MEFKKYSIIIFVLGIFGIGCYFLYYPVYYQSVQPEIAEIITGEQDNVELSNVQAIIADIPQHLFQQLSKTVFYTPEERKQFFIEQGIDYCNQTLVEYEPLCNYQIENSKQYLSNQQEHELLTELYDDDIVLQTLMPMSIRWINEDVGHGVFAEDDASEGAFIGIYGGVVKEGQLVTNKDYAWAYPEKMLEGGKMTLDAKEKGNELRLINDGKDPNCIVKYIPGSDGLWHVCYLALKDIKKGDQLLVSYGPAYWNTRKYGYQELAG